MEQPMTDAEYDAQYDANTLARAKNILKDQSRKSAAEKAAKRMVEKEQKEADSLREIAAGNGITPSQKTSSPLTDGLQGAMDSAYGGKRYR